MFSRRKRIHRYGLFQPGVLMCILTVYLMHDATAQSDSDFASLTEAYADAMVNIADPAARGARLGSLRDEAKQLLAREETAEHYYLLARITGGYTTTQTNVLRMPGLLRDVRNGIEKALEMNPTLLEGVPTAYLGYLYVVAPGWPVSFGNKKKGIALLDEAMTMGAQNLAVNYFYAHRYGPGKDWQSMREQLLKARSMAEPESTQPMLQALLLQSIDDDLARAERQLANQP